MIWQTGNATGSILEKCHRPLASGAVGGAAGAYSRRVCLVSALLLAYAASNLALLIVLAYVVLNVAYSMGLKHVVLLDVFIISTGFMLRILAGTLGVGIAPSHWLLLCGLMLTLFGFAKRRAELNVMAGAAAATGGCSMTMIRCCSIRWIGICATSAIVSYSPYTVSAETLVMHGTANLIYTVPFVIYGIPLSVPVASAQWRR